MGTTGAAEAADAARRGRRGTPGQEPPAPTARATPAGGQRRAAWATIDAALAALADPPPYGALTALAARLNVPPAMIYARRHARRAAAQNARPPRPPTRPAQRATPAYPAAREAASSARAGHAPKRGTATESNPLHRPDPTCCPAPGCGRHRTLLADPRHMPTLPLTPDLIARAGSLGVCDGTPPHYTWVGTADSEILELGPTPG